MLDEFLKEIEDLRKSQALLDEIWSIIGPYGESEKIDSERADLVRDKLRSHYKFTDGE